jgi:hypothetical protein
MGNYVIAVRKYLIVSPSELGNYLIADSQPRPGPAGQRKRDPLQQAAQAGGAALMPLCNSGHLLGERPHRAGGLAAPEPAHLQLNLNGTPAARQVMQAAPVTVVDLRRGRPAAVTGRRPATGAGHDPHAAAQVLNLSQVQAIQVREEQGQDTGFPAGELMQHNDSHGRSS